jgi:hypothetical protein
VSKPLPITGAPRRIGGARRTDEPWPPVPPREDGTRRPLVDAQSPRDRLLNRVAAARREETFETRLDGACEAAKDPKNVQRDPGDGRRDKIKIHDPRQPYGETPEAFLFLDRKTVEAGWSPATIRATIKNAIRRIEVDDEQERNKRKADPRETCGMCRAVQRYGGVCSTHLRW